MTPEHQICVEAVDVVVVVLCQRTSLRTAVVVAVAVAVAVATSILTTQSLRLRRGKTRCLV